MTTFFHCTDNPVDHTETILDLDQVFVSWNNPSAHQGKMHVWLFGRTGLSYTDRTIGKVRRRGDGGKHSMDETQNTIEIVDASCEQ